VSLLAPMTDLEAVNRMLASIGGSPVNTLEVAGVGDVADAKRHLTETLRDVQAVGYSWNTDYGYPLTPDAAGAILLPEGTLDIDASDSTLTIVVRRHPTLDELALYDADNHTFDFSSSYSADNPLEVDIIWGFAVQRPCPRRPARTSRRPRRAASRPRRSTPRSSTASTRRTRLAPSRCSSATSAARATPTVSASRLAPEVDGTRQLQ
jgi:hypothetical protein